MSKDIVIFITHSIRNRKVVGLNPMDGSIIYNNLRTSLGVRFALLTPLLTPRTKRLFV